MTDTNADRSKASPKRRGVLELLNDVRNGTLAPRSLDASDRQRCVEYLLGEGVSIPEIAQLLKRNERTIRRDVDTIRSANALVVDDEFALRLAGELVIEARASMARIRRITRDKDCPHAVRVDGERAFFEIIDGMISRLQSLGFLPMATHRLQADLTHRLGEPIEFGSIMIEAKRLLSTIPGGGAASSNLVSIEAIAADLAPLDAATSVPSTSLAEEAHP